MTDASTGPGRVILGLAAAIVLLAGCGEAAPPPEAVSEPPAQATIDDGLVEALAADKDPHTLYTVANDYAVGAGVEQDQDIAERLWKAACKKGHGYACSNYGSRQIDKGDYDEAAVYLTYAAEAGIVPAIRNLIELYENNNWAGANVDESIKWFEALQALENPQPEQTPVTDEPPGDE